MSHSRPFLVASWTLRSLAALVLLQTLFFKFSGAKESVYIFSILGAEPWGRIGSGVIELIASVLMLLPATAAYGSAIALATAAVAILSHLVRLGVTLPSVGDHGELFTLALVVFVCSGIALILHRDQLLAFVPK